MPLPLPEPRAEAATYLAAFLAWIHRYSAQDRLVAEACLDGRWVTVESDASEKTSFGDLVRVLRAKTRSAPTSAPDSDSSQLVFSASARTCPEAKLAGADLALLLEEDRYVVDYDRALFDPDTVEDMARVFEALFENATRSPESPLAELSLFRGEEESKRLAELRARSPRRWPPSSLDRRFERRVSRDPGATAVGFGADAASHLTYEKLNARANRLARHLSSLGVVPETRVGIYLDNTPDLVVAILATLKAGGAYLPLDVSHPPDRVRYVLEDAEAPIVISDQQHAGSLPNGTLRRVLLDRHQPVIRACSSANLERPSDPSRSAYVMYTSGSTGRPKGVVVEHRNVTRLFDATDAHFGFGADDVFSLFHSPAFDFSVWELFGALLHGGRVVPIPARLRRAPESFYPLLAEEKITVLSQTPSAFRRLSQVEERSERPAELCLRHVVLGGERLDLASLRPWIRRHGDERPRLVNMYGITETTVHVTYRRLRARDVDEVAGSPVGAPIADLDLLVLDPSGRPVPTGVPGEIYVGGAGVARGYLNRPDLTSERFLGHPFSSEPGARVYRTGDIGRLRRDGELSYLGRIDHQVKVRGFRVELGEVEACLAADRGVRQCAVVAQESGPPGSELTLVAFVVPAEGRELDAARLGGWLRRRLPPHMVPSEIVPLAELPLTANGKVDRAALSSRRRDRPSGRDTRRDGALEDLVAEVYERVLGIARLGRHENFFDIGGNSLNVIDVVHELSEHLGRRVEAVRVFEHPTIARLARHLEGTGTGAPTSSLGIEARAAKMRAAAWSHRGREGRRS